ncbi:hypothetical protein [Planococcus salinarum]|uniref:hypothetical protein n=1 Tax=Planococcus salinarum TaxID=622695 RepID=UPI000E3C78AF|nr:hypothetical protein [Planococcus salinarum]TAA66095.1 hypothetical protein D2909_15615 [Planococcus salinarum]
MNNKFWKVAGFSFLSVYILTYLLGVKTIMTTDVNGMVSPALLTDSEYFFRTAGFSLLITAIILLVVYLINLLQKKRRKQSS